MGVSDPFFNILSVHEVQHQNQQQHMHRVKGVAGILERLAVVALPPAVQPDRHQCQQRQPLLAKLKVHTEELDGVHKPAQQFHVDPVQRRQLPQQAPPLAPMEEVKDEHGQHTGTVLSCVALMLAAAVLAALLTKALVQPVLNMTEDLDHIQENVPYRELIPFAESIHSDRILRENNEKMRQEFTANVSHELKTPLTSISGYAELIETGIAKPEDVPDFGRKIHSEATRMIQLVNDILQLSKLDTVSETGDAPVMETVDLLDVAKECVERQKLNARRAYISLTYLGESAPVLGSRALLDELCQNLCDNAIRYNRPGGKVQIITACSRDGHCSLTVTDNGIGIPREAQSSVFERFYRVDKSRSKATGGTGLGLAIVKHIARIHNARIKLESQVDVGTTITVTFPTAS